MWRLNSGKALLADWSPPKVRHWPGTRETELLYFDAHFAVPAKVVDRLAAVLNGWAEFLPLSSGGKLKFYALHVLKLVPIGPRAAFQQSNVSKNITDVTRYSFVPKELGSAQCFRVQQFQDAAAARHGAAGLCTILVREPLRKALDELGLKGAALVPVPTI